MFAYCVIIIYYPVKLVHCNENGYVIVNTFNLTQAMYFLKTLCKYTLVAALCVEQYELLGFFRSPSYSGNVVLINEQNLLRSRLVL